MRITTILLTGLILSLTYGCGGGKSAGSDTTKLETLEPLVGDEIRYLAFQVFEGS